MVRNRPSYSSFVTSAALVIAGAFFCAVSVPAQTAEELIAKLPPTMAPDDAAIHKLIIRGYTAYQQKDSAKLLALFNQQSPYFLSFKQSIEKDFAANERVKIEGLNALLVRNVEFDGDKATARLNVQIHAVNLDSGTEADGFGPTEHTLYFVRDDGVWKIWQFIETAEELTNELLAAGSEAEQAALVKRREPFKDGLLRSLSDQAASLLERQGDDAHAEMIFKHVLTISARVNSLMGKANALVGLGDVYLARGDFRSAADNFQQMMELAEKLDSKQGIAAISVKLGNVHLSQGDYVQALAYFERSAGLYEQLGSNQEIAYPLLSIGNAYFAQQNFNKALEYYQKSLKVYERIFDRGGTAYLLNMIGEVYAAQNRPVEAVNSYQQSLKLQDQYGLKSMTALSLNGIGKVRYQERNFAAAADFAARSTELATAGYYPEVLWRSQTASGRAFRALNKPQQAERAFSEAIAVVEKLRGRLVGNEREQQLFFENKTEPYISMVELLIEQQRWPEAFRYAELAKGRMLLDVLRNGRVDISTTLTAEERSREKQLNASLKMLGGQLSKEASLPKPDPARLSRLEIQLQAARHDAEAYELRLYAAHPDIRIKRGDFNPITVAELEPLIGDTDTAVLEYVVAPKTTYLFVFTKSSVEPGRGRIEIATYSIPIDAAELAQRVQSFRQRLADNSLAFKDQSRQLYDLLLKPAQRQLEGKRRVCVVPDAGLWELPFQALLSGADRYLLEDHALNFVPSLSALAEMMKRTPRTAPGVAGGISMIKVSALPPVSILALGNPKITKDLGSKHELADRDAAVGELPSAEREVKALGEIYGAQNSKVLTGAEAREDTFKAAAGGYPVLHFATHGLLDDDNPLYSRLMLAASGENDDGLLEAREIMKLDLHADLAVLSACQTARGRVGAGEGLIGMSWAFFIAGTSTTVVSQWKVESNSTSQLMVNFHRLLQQSDKRLSKAEALRQAALKLMEEPRYRHPFYWSGFVVVGKGM
jgi:CHAT domain-containing protein